MDFNTWNDHFPSSSEEQTYFTPHKDPSEFEGNKAIESMKQLTEKIGSDITEFISILKENHVNSRTRMRRGVDIALTGLAVLAVIATGGVSIPAVLFAGFAIGGAVMVGTAVLLERINKKKNIQHVEMRWKHFVDDFLTNYVYYCDSEDSARMILTHVKHVVYQEENSYEFFRLLLGSRNPLVTNYCYSDSLYGYLEDATHINQDYRAARESETGSSFLFKILDLIKFSLALDQKSESADSKPLYNLARFLDIFKDVVDSLPNYCDCSRYKVRRPLTTENMIQMYETAIFLAEMCKSDAWNAETYRKKKREAERQKRYEDQVVNQRQLQKKREAELQKWEYDKHPCPGCKAFNCKCIEVCARCERPLK